VEAVAGCREGRGAVGRRGIPVWSSGALRDTPGAHFAGWLAGWLAGGAVTGDGDEGPASHSGDDW